MSAAQSWLQRVTNTNWGNNKLLSEYGDYDTQEKGYPLSMICRTKKIQVVARKNCFKMVVQFSSRRCKIMYF